LAIWSKAKEADGGEVEVFEDVPCKRCEREER